MRSIGTQQPQDIVAENANHLQFELGTIFYVDGVNGNDNFDGLTPKTAFLTIGAGIAELSFGDVLKIKAAMYTEIGLDLDVPQCQLIFDIGVIIAPSTGNCLEVSADYCGIIGDFDMIVPTSQIGLLISGDFCNINKFDGGTILYGDYGIRITGMGNTVRNAACGFQTLISFSLEATQNRLFECHTVGNGNTKGYSINSGADTGILRNCTSSGNGLSGFYIETGSQDWTLLNCSSGAGDGAPFDADNSNVWSGFTFDDIIYKSVTFTTTGAQTYNLFKVTGAVEIFLLSSEIKTAISSDMTAFHLETWDGTTSTDVTKNDGDISGLPTGSLIIKEDKFDNTITIFDASNGGALDEVDLKKEMFRLVQKTGDVDTFLRLSCSSSDTPPSGEILWTCQWRPIGNGFLEKV